MTPRAMPFDLFGIECGKGWARLYEPILTLAAQQGADVLQVKEKWGRLRIYIGGGDDVLEAAIEQAENASAVTCEDCGAEGRQRGRGWIRTLCDTCDAPKAVTP